MKYCECGCGKIVNKGRRFIQGHHRIGKKHSLESKRKTGNANKGRKISEETKRKMSIAAKGKIISDKTRKKMSIKFKGRKHSEETKRKISETRRKNFLSGKYKFLLSKKYKNTSIEIKIEEQFKKRGINYKKQHFIKGIGCVDFYLPEYQLIVECDGDYWHNLPKQKIKDADKDLRVSFNGYKILRFWEHEINGSAKKCINKILTKLV